MHYDEWERSSNLNIRVARLRAALELVDVLLKLGPLAEPEQQALQERVRRSLDLDETAQRWGRET